MNNLVKINNVEHLTAMIKAIVPRSFEKTFGGLSTSEIVAGFAFCVSGLSQTELNTGLAKINHMGFCPDPALFAKWCRGIDGFDNSDYIADGYIGKHGAVANIQAWINNPSLPISTAEKQAYDATYHLWNSLNMADVKNAPFAFADHYQMIVKDNIKNKIPSSPYIAPLAITQAEPVQETHRPLDNEQALAILAKLKRKMEVA